MTENNKIIPLWVCVNQNDFITVHCAQPIRDEEHGKWISKKLFCNNQLQQQVEDMVKMSGMTWKSEPEFIEIEIKQY